MVIEYLQIYNKLVQAFAFQPVRHESGIFRFECMKVCLRHDLSRHVESARARTRNYNFECDWLIKLSDNKLSNNKLSNNKLSDNNLASELVENRAFLNQSQARKL